jgi:hypothetical protein
MESRRLREVEVAGIDVVVRPPDIPSKWDIIPIHSSDVAAFKQCRRRWDWSSPTRNNLRRKVEIFGITMPLWFGTGIHYALERYYDPTLKRDPVETFKTWYQFQWEGGVVTEEFLDHTYDIHPRLLDDGTYRIKGLQEILPDPMFEEFETHHDLGVGMMEFYKGYAEKHDDFIVIAAESTYSIPLGFEWVDLREDSPNYGKKIEVHARGKRDAICYWQEYDRFGIIDHKTAQRIDETYFAKLDKDEQCSNYLWATIQEAALYDLPWRGKIVDRVIYNALRKNYPKPPTELKSGFPSIARSTEGTTAELFETFVRERGLEQWFNNDEKAQAYYTYLLTEGDAMFIQRDEVHRNKYEVEATGEHLKMIAREMLDSPSIYPNPTAHYGCIHCGFRTACISADDGSDWQGMLADSFEVNRDR